ncbi:MAG: hypothetical protein ACI9XU_001448 [Arenicella sp.]|jgi:hypothetical protein
MLNPSGFEMPISLSLTKQAARDRTGVTLYGDAEAAERFLVATNGALMPSVFPQLTTCTLMKGIMAGLILKMAPPLASLSIMY